MIYFISLQQKTKLLIFKDMVNLVSFNLEPIKKDFYGYVDGALVATGTLSFSNYKEMELAKNVFSNNVALSFGCDPKKVYVTIHKHYGK